MTESTHVFDETEGGLVGDGGIRVGHGQDHGDTSVEGGGGSRGEVLLVRGARLAQVDVHVDQARYAHHAPRRDAVDVRLHLGRLADQSQSLM